MPDRTPTLDLPALNAALAGTEFADRLHHLTTIDSTQTLAHEAARSGARHGVWIADEQTAGRGRGPTPGTPPPAPRRARRPLPLGPRHARHPHAVRRSASRCRTAIAVQSAIAETTGLRAPQQIDIRWPNDLSCLNQGPLKKSRRHPHRTGRQPRATPTRPRHAPLRRHRHRHQPQPASPSPPSSTPSPPPSAANSPATPSSPANLSPPPSSATSTRNSVPCPEAHSKRDNPQPRNLSHHSTWLTGKRVRVEPRPATPIPTPTGYTGTTAGLDPQGFLLVHGDDGQLHTVLSGGLREP